MRAGPVPRRAFLGLAGGAVAALAGARRAGAAEARPVGLVVPTDPALAAPLRRGAELGLAEANVLATLFGKRLALEVEAAADPGVALAAARALARRRALAVVGGAGGAFGSAWREAAAEGVVVMNVAAADEVLRNERCAPTLCHVLPSVTMYVDALVQWARERRRAGRFALVSDGSERGREVEAALRRAVGRTGGALVPDGEADLVLLATDAGGARAALARARGEGRAASIAGIGDEVPLALAAEEAAGAWIVAWHHELERFSARELNNRFRRRFGAPLTEVAWAAWAAVKLVGEAVVRADVQDGAGLRRFIDSAAPFDGHKGSALTFRPWDRQLRQPLYVIGPRPADGVGRGAFGLWAEVGGDDPDRLGTTAAETRCRRAG
jgi:ABC-type branched-subunit amino acid transport system substrate-binding protein